MATEKNRDACGRFRPGRSGNPKGARPGTPNAYRRLLADRAGELIGAMVAAALGGDTACMRWCCDRLIGPVKATAEPVSLPSLDGTPVEQADAILRATGAGQVPPDAATSLMIMIRARAELGDLEEIKRELRELRERLKP